MKQQTIQRTNKQNSIIIDELKKVDDGLILCSEAYKNVFNGAPFYEDWTMDSAMAQVLSYIEDNALILSSSYQDKVIGFLVAMSGTPENQKKYVTLKDEEVKFIEEIGVIPEYRNQKIASKMVAVLLSFISSSEKYFVYRTNAMRYFEQLGGESFEAGVERVQKEDKIKRINNEKIIIPDFNESEKQKFINQYLELLSYRPDLDVSNSNQLFRKLFGGINFCKNGTNYSYQIDPSSNGNDRIFSYVDLENSDLQLIRRK